MSEYPRMLYRDGGDLNDHKLQDTPLKIMGKFTCDTRIVESSEEEAEAMAEGWAVSPDPDVQAAAQIAASRDAEKDAEIAMLKAQLEEATAPAAKKGAGNGNAG